VSHAGIRGDGVPLGANRTIASRTNRARPGPVALARIRKTRSGIEFETSFVSKPATACATDPVAAGRVTGLSSYGQRFGRICASIVGVTRAIRPNSPTGSTCQREQTNDRVQARP